MSDDLIGRLVREQGIKPEAAALLNHDQKRLLITGYIGPPCSDRSILDRCTHHQGVNCFHDDHRSGLAAPRFLQQCVTCRPERWSTVLSEPMVAAESLTQSQPFGRPSWDEYFFGIAKAVSKRATCPRAAIGTVLVDKHHRIVSTGFNGAKSGEPHCVDVGCNVFAEHCTTAEHAEENSVRAAFEIIKGTVVTDQHSFKMDGGFLTNLGVIAFIWGPRDVCARCARILFQAGVKEVRTTNGLS